MNTEKKNQHFVPKFYLRNFSFNSEGKRLAVYNTLGDLWIPKASLKGQAQKDFFYGMDGRVEEALGKTENEVAPLLRRVINEEYIPAVGTDDHLKLLHFLMLTDARNPVNTREIMSRMPMLNEYVQQLSGGANSIPDEEMTTHEEALELSFRNVATAVAITKDLRLKLIRNATSVPYITCDNPVVKYNQFLESRKWMFSGTGLAAIGLQVFMPLSPEMMLIAYDDLTYRIGDKKKNILVIANPKEVDQLNLLQVLNCDCNLFGNERLTEQYLKKLRVSSVSFSKANQPSLKPINMYIDGEKKDVVNATSSECRISLSIVGISQTKAAKHHELSNRAVQIRNRTKPVLNLIHGPGW